MRITNIPFELETNHLDNWNYISSESKLEVSALPYSDIYINPAGIDSADAQSLMNATTLLGLPPEGDFQFVARITVDFKSSAVGRSGKPPRFTLRQHSFKKSRRSSNSR